MNVNSWWIYFLHYLALSLVFVSSGIQVDRHLRKLDQELAKFKMELEADNAGITEILERRKNLAGDSLWSRCAFGPEANILSSVFLSGSLEMDSPSQPVNNHHVHSHTTAESKFRLFLNSMWPQISNHYCKTFVKMLLNKCLWSLSLTFIHIATERKYSAPTHHTTEHVPEKKFKSEALLSTLTSDASKENTPGESRAAPFTCTALRVRVNPMSPAGSRTNSTSTSTSNVYSVNCSQPLPSYNLSSLPAGAGAGAGAITMAAAQAVQATAQVRKWEHQRYMNEASAHGCIFNACCSIKIQ